MSMDCREARSLMSAYIDNALGKAEQESLIRHVSMCSGCRLELDALQSVAREIRLLGEVKAPDRIIDSIHERIRAEGSEPLLKRVLRFLFFPLSIKIPVELAGVAVVAVIVFALFRATGPQGQVPAPAMISPESSSRWEDALQEPPAMGEPRGTTEAVPAKAAEQPAQAAKAPSKPEKQPPKAVSRGMPSPTSQPSAPLSIAPEEPIDVSLVIRSEEVRRNVLRAQAGAEGETFPGAGASPAPPAAASEAKDEAALNQDVEAKKAAQAPQTTLQPFKEPQPGQGDDAVKAVQALIASVNGTVLSTESDGQSGRIRLITARIPTDRIEKFFRRIKDLTVLKEMPQQPPAEGKGKDRLVKIRLIYDEAQQ